MLMNDLMDRGIREHACAYNAVNEHGGMGMWHEMACIRNHRVY